MATKPFVLVICDGWGENPETAGNAIAQANTPHVSALKAKWPHATVEASGEAVGLPAGQIGNSEVGHLTIGAGRIIHQPLSRQFHEMKTGKFYENEVLITAIETAKQRGTDLHIMGLVSPGGVHSHQDSAIATARLAKQLGLTRVHVHAFTDGRDVPPTSAKQQIKEFEANLQKEGTGKIRSLAGRYYAMDRDNRWERTEQAYRMLTDHNHPAHPSPTDYIQESYDREEHDEFIRPMSIATGPEDRVKLEDGDVVVFFNFRPDRARQLTHALVDSDFQEFDRQRVVRDLHIVTFSEYDRSLTTPVAFPKEDVREVLAEVISTNKGKQFHIAETEKYAHVTYFVNGGREAAFPGEDRQLIPSPKVSTYDLAPAMSAEAVADAVIERLNSHDDDIIVVNFANADMLGHTGKMDAAIQGVETVDQCLGRVVDAALAKNGAVLITADHGNAEKTADPKTGAPLTAHTTSPVPVILCGTQAQSLRTNGGLQDIAPTVLDVIDLPIPETMTGSSLIKG